MKKFLINLVVILSLFLISEISGNSFLKAMAADEYLDPYVEGNLSVGRCVAKGNNDFLLFLRSVSNFEGILGFYEPFWDVLSRNQCQGGDLLSLTKQKDKLRDRIRDAFLLCQNEKIPALKKGYFTVDAEIYYVRNIVKSNIAVNLPYDFLSTNALQNPASLYTDSALLKSEIREKYVGNGKFSSLEFDILFEKLETKYKDRKPDYIICNNSSWEAVTEKWKEFINTAGGLGPAAENFADGVGGRAEKIVESAKDPSMSDFASGIFQLNLNGRTPIAEFSEIFDSLLSNMPEIDVPGARVSQKNLLNAYVNERKNHELKMMQESMIAKFETSYREASDGSIAVFVEELEKMNSIIVDSFNPLDKVFSCAFTMNLRQCSNK